MLDFSSQSRRASHAERGVDLYETPDVAISALRRVENLPKNIWEPACGPGRIVKNLRSAQYNVYASDLISYDPDLQDNTKDFFFYKQAPKNYNCIVTNPPYKLVDDFVRHALKLCPRVIMLLRLAFYESERRRDILENHGLVRIHCFRKRLPMMHRAGWEGKKANSGMAFAWFVWDQNAAKPTHTIINRISWESPSA